MTDAAFAAEIVHPDGVYINLSHSAHVADSAIGATGLKQLVTSPPDWWWGSVHNTIAPEPKPAEGQEDRAAFARGTACHVGFLFGMEVYKQTYGYLPTKADFPDALDTVEELRAYMRQRVMSTAGNKEDLIVRLHNVLPNTPILEVIQRRWRALGKRVISRNDDRKIQLLHMMAMRTRDEIQVEEGEVILLRDLFTGVGLSEVSVFWTDEYGIRHRARFDRMKPNVTADLKTITKWKHGNFKAALLREIILRGYMLQAVHYDEGRRQFRRLVGEGKVFITGEMTPELKASIDAVADPDFWAWVFVFAKMNGFPAVKGIRVQQTAAPYIYAQNQRTEALSNFVYYRSMFGLADGAFWYDPETVWTPEDEQWPSFIDVTD